MQKSLVLSDNLLKQYYLLVHGESYDNNLIKKLLHFYKSVHITNIEQLKRVGIENSSLMQGLAQNGLISQTLEELSCKTKYKLILNTVKNLFPYLNIFDDIIENNYTSTHYKHTNRDKSIKHIKALLLNSNSIFIYDRYLNNNWNNTEQFFKELVPKKSLTVYYTERQLNQNNISKIKSMYNNWSVVEDRSNTGHRKLHDRYLIIDNEIEIILTSGFDYLFDDSKDFTYIIRDLD